MTTIAYKAGVLAADTQITVGDVYSYHIEKLVRVDEREAWVAMAGNIGEFSDFLEWFRSTDEEADGPELEDFVAIVLYDDGDVAVISSVAEVIDHPKDKPMAVGSGAMAALGAMYAGKTAEEAVMIAALVDPATGAAVQTVKAGARRKKKQPRHR